MCKAGRFASFFARSALYWGQKEAKSHATGNKMDDEMNTAEVLRDEAKENRTREILELMRNSKTLEEAMEKVKALLNK